MMYDGMMNDDNHTFISYESNSSIQSLQRILTTNVDKDNNINDYNTHNNLNLSSSASIAEPYELTPIDKKMDINRDQKNRNTNSELPLPSTSASKKDNKKNIRLSKLGFKKL